MTSYSYNRKYELIVSQPFEEADTSGQFLTNPLYNDYTFYKVAEDYRKVSKLRNVAITSLHFTCKIKRNTGGGANTDSAVIEIYNLNKDNESIVQNVGNYVVLNAGYENQEDNLPMVYSGQVSDCYTEQRGQDLVTILMCKDGYIPLNSVRLSYSKPKGSSYASIIKDISNVFKANGVQIGEMVLNTPSGTAPFRTGSFADTVKATKGWSFMGYARDAMTELCDSIDYKWEIINNTLYVYPNWWRNLTTTVTVSTSNILSVQKQRKGTNATSSNKAKDQEGLKVKLLLDGRITKSAKLSIEDGEYRGTYKIETVSHDLSYEGQQWWTEVDVIKT